ncbi:putative hydro-lyase [Salibacterium aidingense]|uniref:putative hydro-lyase n=1 Tax=Salibacterium aidingense TaxID=384933 RepID=UPI003BDDF0C6
MQTPAMLREKIRYGSFQGPTSGQCPDFVQANVVIVPKAYAFDFFLFAHRNPDSCPLVDVFDAGVTESRFAPGSDIRNDVPRYRIYRHGTLTEETTSIKNIWLEDWVTFLIGCSFTFESILQQEGIPLRHIEENKNVAMYVTDRPTKATTVFHGPLVVSMRPVPQQLVQKASEVTASYPNMHGAPVHAGNPSALGIADIEAPDFGDKIHIRDNELPVFWACGVTPQMAAMESRLPFMITHAPGHMFVTDVTNEKFLKQR